MAITAKAIILATRVFEFLAVGIQLFEFFAAALGENDMAGIAFITLDAFLAIR